MAQKDGAELDHISLPVKSMKAAKSFYPAALGAIGMKVNAEYPSALALGAKDEKILWLTRDSHAAGHGHYAFRVHRRREVDEFHSAAIEAGGVDNGKPGLRPDYGPSYYAAFVKDAEGNNIEVVCYEKEAARGARKKPVKA